MRELRELHEQLTRQRRLLRDETLHLHEHVVPLLQTHRVHHARDRVDIVGDRVARALFGREVRPPVLLGEGDAQRAPVELAAVEVAHGGRGGRRVGEFAKAKSLRLGRLLVELQSGGERVESTTYRLARERR